MDKLGNQLAKPTLQTAMKQYWGYESFRPLQRESMECGLSHRDSLVILPTGGGKSLCFQVPAVCHDGLTVVVSPLISLMKDQVDTLRECGVEAAQLNSSMSTIEKREIDVAIRENRLKLLYVAPERLATDAMIAYLKRCKVSMIAIDEAHCISAWGHDFRPEYRMLGTLKEHFPGIGIHAYTATASEKVRDDIASQLRLDNPKVLVGNFDRPNLTYRVVPSKSRFEQVCNLVLSRPGESGVVYCISRKEVDRVSEGLQGLGVRVLPYHAGLDDVERKTNQEAFLQDRCDVIVATVAFGMGIDKPDVRYVIHAGAPKSLEHYQQESGRAGRDGLEADCTLLYSPGDIITWSKMLTGNGSLPETQESQLRSLDTIRDYCTTPTCRHQLLVRYFGQELASDNCGACDVCLNEIDVMEDSLRISQMIVSCVVRLNQRYGVDYTAKVLTATSEPRINSLGHDKLSTHGLLSEYPIAAVKSWMDQIIAQGYLARTTEQYSTVTVTASGKRLLKGDASVRLSRPVESTVSKRTKPNDSWEGIDRGVFEMLRNLRSRLSTERKVPAFVIFGDTTLREIARVRPSTLQAFSQLPGVGERKLLDLGQAFIDATVEYCKSQKIATDVNAVSVRNQGAQPVTATASGSKQANLTPSSIATFAFWKSGMSIEAVCEKTSRARSTVCGYLGDYIQTHRITDPSPWVSASEIAEVESAIAATRITDRLRPLFDYTEGKISFDSIRFVLGCYNNRMREQDAGEGNLATANDQGSST